MPTRTVAQGVAWMTLGMSGIAVVDAVAKHLTASLNGVQIAWGYFVAMLGWTLLYGAARPGRLAAMARSRRRGLQAVRATCLVVALSSMFLALAYLPLAEATTLAFTAPLFVVALAGPVLGESVSAARWAAVAAGLVGVVLVVRPGSALFDWPAAFPLVGALFFAGFSIATRLLGPVDPVATTLFHTFALGAALLSVAVPVVWTPPTLAECLTLAGTGLLGIVAHLSIVRALRLAEASTLAPINYVRLVWATLIGALAFGQTPGALALLGALVIVGSGLYVVLAPGAR